MADCAFCAVVAGEHDVYVLREDDATLAFLDENPARKGHTVVIPKTHREELLGGNAGGAAVFDAVDAVAADLRRALDPDGFSVFYTSGSMVGSIRHGHVHVVPREAGDDVSLALERSALDHDAAADLAARIRDAEH
ncbi:HIT family protein [Halolamina sediminis]|uniref:HIT family protein n=1 Tax=Halolamina sediminis TaxID=1480675 RepID=UPI0006B5CC84|nr:HIT domain-containing protein [Halolamina sediminis]